MVHFKDKHLTIIVNTPYPTEILNGLQTSIIEVVQAHLTPLEDDKELELEKGLANSCVLLLEFLKNTLTSQ